MGKNTDEGGLLYVVFTSESNEKMEMLISCKRNLTSQGMSECKAVCNRAASVRRHAVGRFSSRHYSSVLSKKRGQGAEKMC